MNRSILVLLFVVGCADATAPTDASTTPIVFEPTVIENSFNTTEAVAPTVEQDAPFEVLSGDLPQEELMFFEFMNQERLDAGLTPLISYWGLEDDAFAHSHLMADTNNLHHNPNLSGVVPSGYWKKLGENVGVGPTVLTLHNAFMNSPGHAANVLSVDFTHVGIKAVRVDGTMWVTFVFMQTNRPGIENTFAPFHDDDFTPHERAISKIYDAGITFGCSQNPISFCPKATVTRGQMAAFLVRALELPTSATDAFTDDNGRWFEGVANTLAQSSITTGCGPTSFCGEANVTRGQMATFLDRGFDYPTSTTDYFVDDTNRFYEAHANDLARAGITSGCAADRFCGEDPITREQMATFLTRALGL